MGLRVKTHIYHSITWIAFDEAFDPLQWAHLPRNQIIGVNIHPAWVCRPNFGWVEISRGEKILLDARYLSSDLLAKRLVDRSADEEVFKTMEYCEKYPGLTYSGGRENMTSEKGNPPSQII